MTVPLSGSSIARRIDMARRDPYALGQLLERYRGLLLFLAEGRLDNAMRCRAGASDVLQETLLDAHKGFLQFAGSTEAELIAWLKRILLNNLVDMRRKRDLPRRPAGDGLSDEEAIAGADGKCTTPSQGAIRNEQRQLLLQALLDLPERQREAVLMARFQGLEVRQIANALGCSPTAAAGLVKRGMQTLLKSMGIDTGVAHV